MTVMKLLIISTMIFVGGAFPAFGQAAKGTRPDADAPVKAAFEVLVEGIRKADAAQVMGVYHNSPETLFFNNNGTVTLGWEQMRSNRESAYSKVSAVTLETSGVRVRMLGNSAAYLTCRWKQSQTSDGRQETASGRMTLVFRLIGKEWKVVHAHTSPDAPDTNRPVMQSERDEQ